ncbi:MAG: ATP-binding protein [Longimicrobiales bacterium]
MIVDSSGEYGPPLKRLLEAASVMSMRVTLTDTLESALRHGRAQRWDLAVMNLQGAGSAAADALGQLREAVSAPIVAIAAPHDDAAQLGIEECIGPGESAESLARCVRHVLERRRLQHVLEAQRRELADVETRFRNIVERAADGIIIVSRDRLVRFVNPAAERLFGRSAAELLDHEFGYPVVAGERTDIDILQRAGAGSSSIVAELRVAATQWEGEPAQLVMLRDITERRRSEEQAQRLLLEQSARQEAERAEQRARFLAEASAALDASLDYASTLSTLARLITPRLADWCVIDLIEEGQVRRVAAAHADPAREALFDELRRRYPPSLGSPHPASRSLNEGEVMLINDADVRLLELTEDEEHRRLVRQLGISAVITVPLESRADRIGAITFVRSDREFDVHDLFLAEDLGRRAGQAIDNARLYRAALAASQAKSDFLAVISHELRTPLNAIMGYTDILLTGLAGELEHTQHEHLRRISASARHLLQIIEEILSYARMEAGRENVRAEASTLGNLIAEAIAVAEPLVHDKGLAFHQAIAEPHTQLVTDAGKIRQILLNLLSNAVKFTDAGSVTLTTGAAGDQVYFRVADTGIGIAEEHLETIFEPFWQVERVATRRTGGTGLGLSVSRRLAELLGGTITVTSELGRGSTFELRLPKRLAGFDTARNDA